MSKTILTILNIQSANKIHSHHFAEQRGYALLYFQWISALFNHFIRTNTQRFGVGLIHNESAEVKKSGKGSHCSLKIMIYILTLAGTIRGTCCLDKAQVTVAGILGSVSAARDAAGAGTLAAGFTALCLHVWQVATTQPAKSLTETKCESVTETNCFC